jgi:D-alanyl-D-alanine carboxypeptidase
MFLNSTIVINAQDFEIFAPSAVLIDAKTGTILFEKNKDEKHFPASTTKIMTTLLTLENCKNLEDKVKMSHNAIYSIEPGSSHIAMNEGETLTVEQSLYGLLLASANEVANALAEYISTNINDFCKLMNERAKQLGCKNTNFVNAHDFHNENHYTSAYDLALIMKEDIKYEEFNKIISTKRYDIPPTEKQPETRILYNTNKMIQSGKYFNENVIGGKTGYTDEAGHTLVIYAKKNDMQLISVVMAEENSNAYLDTTKLLDYGFSKFHNVELLKTNDYQKNCVVTQKYKNKTLDIDTVNIYPQKDIILNLPDSINKEDLKLTAKLPEKISAPVNKNKSVGQISVIYKNQILEKINLVPEENINVLDEKVIAKINRNQVIHKIFFTSIKILSYSALFIGIIIIIAILIRKFNIWRNKKRRR